jgi:NTP pyrophosphatase (non-canonical NTP hydrolase)
MNKWFEAVTDAFNKTAMSRIGGTLIDIVNIGRLADPVQWTPSDVLAKLGEEAGELSRAVQIKRGKLPSKTQPDGEEFRECADVINCAIDAVSQVNRDLTPEEIIARLQLAMIEKNAKWKGILLKERV